MGRRSNDLTEFAKPVADEWLEVLCYPNSDAAPCEGDCTVDYLDLEVLCDHWLEITK